jgi:hypothetical protein
MVSWSTALPVIQRADDEMGARPILGVGSTSSRASEGFETVGTTSALTYQTEIEAVWRGKPLRLPIIVTVRRTPDHAVVSEDLTGIFGTGDTVTEAKQDFLQALVDFRDVLAHRDRLSFQLADLLAVLTSRLAQD